MFPGPLHKVKAQFYPITCPLNFNSIWLFGGKISCFVMILPPKNINNRPTIYKLNWDFWQITLQYNKACLYFLTHKNPTGVTPIVSDYFLDKVEPYVTQTMCNMLQGHNLGAKYHRSIVSQPQTNRQGIFGIVFWEVNGLQPRHLLFTHFVQSRYGYRCHFLPRVTRVPKPEKRYSPEKWLHNGICYPSKSV